MAKLSDIKPISLQSLLKNHNDSVAALAGAAVIIAQDPVSGAKSVVYGRELLEDVARSKARHAIKVLVVELDLQSDELARLTGLIDLAKGRLGSAAG